MHFLIDSVACEVHSARCVVSFCTLAPPIDSVTQVIKVFWLLVSTCVCVCALSFQRL